jgi:hypothetical protein
MKKINLLLVVIGIYFFAGANMAYGFSGVKPIGSPMALNYLQPDQFIKLSPKQFTALTGQKLNFFQRLSFKLTKMKLKHDLKKNPDLKLTDYINASGDGNTTFQIDILWLFLGFLVGIGVIAAYLTKQEKYKITSAWIGLGLFVAGAIIFGHSIF